MCVRTFCHTSGSVRNCWHRVGSKYFRSHLPNNDAVQLESRKNDPFRGRMYCTSCNLVCRNLSRSKPNLVPRKHGIETPANDLPAGASNYYRHRSQKQRLYTVALPLCLLYRSQTRLPRFLADLPALTLLSTPHKSINAYDEFELTSARSLPPDSCSTHLVASCLHQADFQLIQKSTDHSIQVRIQA